MIPTVYGIMMNTTLFGTPKSLKLYHSQDIIVLQTYDIFEPYV